MVNDEIVSIDVLFILPGESIKGQPVTVVHCDREETFR